MWSRRAAREMDRPEVVRLADAGFNTAQQALEINWSTGVGYLDDAIEG